MPGEYERPRPWIQPDPALSQDQLLFGHSPEYCSDTHFALRQFVLCSRKILRGFSLQGYSRLLELIGHDNTHRLDLRLEHHRSNIGHRGTPPSAESRSGETSWCAPNLKKATLHE